MANPLNLKVGDKVRLELSASPGYRGWFCGQDILEVAKIDENDNKCTYKLKSPNGGMWWVHNSSILGKVEDVPDPSDCKFNVGDKVRVMNHRPTDPCVVTWTPNMDKYMGKVGTVERVTECSVHVDFDDGIFWNYQPEWLTLVKRQSPSILDSILDSMRPKHDNPIKSNLPLINTTKLLPNIKID